jgi:hypothetical protein
MPPLSSPFFRSKPNPLPLARLSLSHTYVSAIMDKRDYRYSPVANELSDFATDALSFTPTPARGKPRDAAWLRWLKYLR